MNVEAVLPPGYQIQKDNVAVAADHDAEAAAEPSEQPPPPPPPPKNKPSVYCRPLILILFVLLAMAATGVIVWYVMDSREVQSASSPPPEQDDDAKTTLPPDVIASLPPAGTPPPTAPAPPSLPLLVISETKPLWQCMGDCDEDSDCGPGLKCFQRSNNMEVPGCSGGLQDSSNTDYCIPTERPIVIETNEFPLGRCEGDCDSNNDCRDGLVCYQRSEFEDVPGCSGGTADFSRTDYCVPRSLVPETYLVSLGDGKLVGNPDDNFGSSVSLSQSEPLLMAVGAVDRGSTGYVNIYQLEDDTTNWVLAATIPGTEIGSDFGHSVSMSWDGKYVAVGMPAREISSTEPFVGGRVRVFELSSSSSSSSSPQPSNSTNTTATTNTTTTTGNITTTQITYQQVGSDILAGYDTWEGGFGHAVSLSNDGRILAVTQQSVFSAYERTDAGDWVLLGSEVDIGSFGGGSVSLSGDGSRVAVNVNDPSDGYGRVYELTNGTSWVQVGQTLGDLSINDSFGLSNMFVASTSLSGDGTTVVMSCIDRTTGNSYVRAYHQDNAEEWIPMGEPILSQLDAYAPASKVEITKDGKLLAIGDYALGRVRLYEFGSKISQWTLVGQVHSENEEDQLGVTLSVSGGKGEETYLAIGGPSKKHVAGSPGFAVTYKTSFGIRPDPTFAPTSAPTSLSGGSSNPSIFSETSAWYGQGYDDIQTVGQAVALSGDGQFFAFGKFSETATNKVEIYSDGPESEPIGELSGLEIGDEFGYSISLSHDGQRIAVGMPNSRGGSGGVKVYEYDQAGSAWQQMGDDLVGSSSNLFEPRFGHSVSLNKDGDIIAVGAPSSETGVSIFRFENNEWVKMGDDITVPADKAAYHGWSVSLSSDGLVVAIGGPTNEDNWDEAGACRIYEYVNNTNSTNWQPRGQPILGQERHGLLGTSVSLSDDGNIVAVGAINYDLPEAFINEEGVYRQGDKAGAVLVYEYSSEEGDWRSLGKTIMGDAAFDRFGTSVSLVKHENKLHLAVGAPEHGNGGQVRLFVYDDEHSYWDQVDDVQRYDPSEDGGKNAGFGTTLALVSGSDGLRMAVGAPRARSGYGERLGLIPKYDGEVTTWH